MATFVLVHPAWFGAWCWRKVVPLLREQGHDVHTPTLTGLGERAHLAQPGVDLDTHIEDVVSALVFEDLDEVTVVGSSSAGMVLTGVAERVPERIARLVFLDAFVPEDRQSLRDLVPPDRLSGMLDLVRTEGFGWLLPRFAAPPWATFLPQAWQVTDEADLAWALPRLRPTPFGHFTRAVRRSDPAAAALPRTFIRCTRWPHPGFDRYAKLAGETRGWRLRHLDVPHLPYLTHPAELVAALTEPGD